MDLKVALAKVGVVLDFHWKGETESDFLKEEAEAAMEQFGTFLGLAFENPHMMLILRKSLCTAADLSVVTLEMMKDIEAAMEEEGLNPMDTLLRTIEELGGNFDKDVDT